MAGQRGQQLPRPGLLQQQRRGPGPQREDQQPAEAEGEAERRAAREHVVGGGPQDLAGEGVRDGQQIPVEMHTALGLPGGPRGERDQRDLVGGRVDRPVRAGAGVRGRQPGQVPGVLAAVQRGPQPLHVRLGQIRGRPRVAQRVAHPGEGADGGQLARPGLRQDGHGDRARLHDGEPAGGQPRCGGPAQQHPVAGHHAQIAGQDVRDAVDGLPQLPVAPDAPVARVQRGAVGPPLLDRAVEQLMTAVEPIGVLRPGRAEEEPWPLVRWWQVVARERVGVRAGDAYGRVGGGGRVRRALRRGRGIRLHEGSPPCRFWSVSFG